MAGLLGFVAVYLGLTGYCAFTAYRLITGSKGALGFVLAIPALFVFGFLLRGLFVVKHATDPRDLEIHEADEPRLFAFLHRLADETGAPRPHRVFLSPEVNACVFYDLSFWNLIVPSKKNLVLGLGLVNVLSLDELKAVVAHEYGHFAQKTMAVGRWVYVARQIAGNIVVARTGFDRVLDFISRVDLRVAWIGWLMRLVVWAIRAVLDTVLRVVVLAHRALGRNMELQADRVAVSVSGSDSLIHALHRLGPADEAWHEAARFAFDEQRAGRPVEDVFAVQTAALEHLRRVLDEPSFGATPPLPEGDVASHRVFAADLASPPRMWATHPPNRDREEHAKAVYLASVLDTRSAFVLFTDPAEVRRRVTRAMFAPAGEAPEPAQAPADPVPLATSLAAFEERFARAALDPRYRGMYLGRPFAAYHESTATMVESREATPEDIRARLEALYPSALRQVLAKLRECREEETLLEALADGVLTAPGGLIRHRGQEIRRGDLPSVLARVREERRSLEVELVAHDVSSRAAHLGAARALGGGWPAYLEHLLALLHFATHAARKVDDARTYLAHVVEIVLADGHVSASERRRVLAAADDLHAVLAQAFHARDALAPAAPVAARFERRGGCSALNQKLGLGSATEANLGEWLSAAEWWARGAADDLHVLAEATLDELLETERHVARHFLEGADPGAAPELGTVPGSYPSCIVGAERPRQKRLGPWDRFQVADGLVPGIARFGVASGVLLPAMFLGGAVGTATIHAHNGLSIPVEVTIDGTTETIAPYQTEVFRCDERESLRVRTRTLDGRLVEAFHTPSVAGFGDYVYNVAQAAPLVHWTAAYGSAAAPDDRPMGAPRWLEASEQVIFDEPPESISTRSSGGGTRTVLTAVSGPEVSPTSALALTDDPEQRAAVLEAHIAWEPSGSEVLAVWAAVTDADESAFARLLARAEAEPDDLVLQTIVSQRADRETRRAPCERHRARAEAMPDDPDRVYLATLCTDDRAARHEAYVTSYAQHPEHPWLALGAASVFAGRGRWGEALEAWESALAGVRTPVLASEIAGEAIRTRRAAAQAGFAVTPSWRPPEYARNGVVAFLDALEAEDSADDPPIIVALERLRAGELDGAVATFGDDSVSARRVLALAGASDGADETLRRTALALSPEDLDVPVIGALAALALREGADAEPFFAALEEAYAPEPIEGLAEALAAPDLAESPERLEALAEGRSLRTAATVKAMGVVVLAERAPAAWREEARAALFDFERPFFRPTMASGGEVR